MWPQAQPGGVLVVGDIMTDVIVKPDGPIARGSDCRAAIRILPGGSGANQAAWLAHFGVPVSLVAKVGEADLVSCEQMMRRFGVVPRLRADAERQTGVLVNLVDADGERSFLTDRGANDTLARDDLPDDLLDGIALLHISGYALFAEGPRRAVLDLAARARKRDVAMTVDPSSTAFLQDVGAGAFLDWTTGAAICCPNDDETALLAGTRDEDQQRAILSRHYGLTVIKRGARGAEIAGAEGACLARLPAPKVAVIDTTGAGDAFLAGFFAGFLAGQPPEDCLRQAIAAGSAATISFGGRPPKP
jgi:sugar/nucleoside kinase (ribokinase family)